MNKLRVAIVGAGYVANHHLAALRGVAFVELAGICDTNLEAARAMAARHSVPVAVSDLAELLDLARPDVVHVLTPPASHAPVALAAMEHGCHVLVEKPMADSVAECEAMLAKSREKKVLLGVNHSDLFDPVIRKALDLVAGGRIGKVLAVDILRSSDYPSYQGGPLPALVTQGSYPFRDLGVHGLYTIEAFAGQISSLEVEYSSSGANPALQFDEWRASMQAGDARARLLLSWNARPMENRLEVRGTSGRIEVDRFLQVCRLHRNFPGPKFAGIALNALLNAAVDLARIPWNILRFATGALAPSPGIRRGAVEFVEAVRDHATPPFPAEAGLRLARLLDPVCAGPDAARLEQLRGRHAPLPPASILVTGANGFLGRALLGALKARGDGAIRVLVRRPPPPGHFGEGVQVVLGDLGDPEIVSHAVRGVDVVYHVGATMRGTPGDFESGTVWGTRNVVRACREHGVSKLVHVSSMGLLDHAGRMPGVTVTEDHPLEPHPDLRGAYTRTKLAAEREVLDAISAHSLPATIIRPGQIFGPGAESSTPNGVVQLAGRWVAVGSGDCTIPLVYVDDVVDAILLAAGRDCANGGIFHVVDRELVTQEEYLARAAAHFGGALRIARVPSWSFMALATALEAAGKLIGRDVPLTRYRVRSLRPLAEISVARAEDVLGWRPAVGVREGLRRTFGA